MPAPLKPAQQQQQESPQARQTATDKRAEDKRKLRAALDAALAVPQNQHVLIELAKR